MLLKIFGWFWIVAGVIFLLKPQILKNRLQKKGLRKLRKYFFALAIILGGLLISVGFRFQGLLAKIVMIIGIIAIFKAVMLLKAKTAEKLMDWSGSQPLIFFRIGACFWIFTGVVLLLLK